MKHNFHRTLKLSEAEYCKATQTNNGKLYCVVNYRELVLGTFEIKLSGIGFLKAPAQLHRS